MESNLVISVKIANVCTFLPRSFSSGNPYKVIPATYIEMSCVYEMTYVQD